jgi:Ca2+-binding RTX toxin-like protein
MWRLIDRAGATANLTTGTAYTYYLRTTDFTWVNPNGQGIINLANIENLRGTALGDKLIGDANDNILDGRGGNDILTGGAGADIFQFTFATGVTAGNGNIDTITDFQAGIDKIQLAKTIFTSIPTTGVLDVGSFVIGAAAVDTNDFLIYNSGTGALFYDADGSNAGAAVQIALLGTGLALSNTDFVVI